MVACPYGIFCVSDRRLVNLVTGKVVTNRSTKMTMFACADAHGVIVYNGIGMDDTGLTPSEWLLELHVREKIFDGTLSEILNRVAGDLRVRLQSLRTSYGTRAARHTFVVGAWNGGSSIIFGVSNYERVDEPGESPVGSEEVVLSEWPPRPGALIRIVTTGVLPPRAALRSINDAVKAIAFDRVKALCVKAVKDVAYGKGKGRGSVGSSCQWAVVGPRVSEAWFGLDVVGGSVAQEMPNTINIAAEVPIQGTLRARIGGANIITKDAYAGDANAVGIAKYDSTQKKAVFSEPVCGICNTPWPASQRECEVCLYDRSVRDRRNR